MKPKSDTAAETKTIAVEAIISRLLAWGVTASLLLLAIGTVLCFTRTHDYGFAGGTSADLHRLLAGAATRPRALTEILRGLFAADGAAWVAAGLLLLIATPVLRVAISILAFARGRDRAYVLITSVVLALLILSFVLGKAG